MKKFKCYVTKTIECSCIIELDETKFTKEWMEEFSGYMFPISSLENIAEDLAYHTIQDEQYSFIEGYGYVLVDGTNPFANTNFLDKNINITQVSKNEDFDYDITQI